MRMLVGLSLLAIVTAVTVVHADDENETKLKVSECPKAVRKTLRKEVAQGKIVDVDVRQINGVAIYESEVWYDDLEYDLLIRGDGTLLAKHLEEDGTDDDSDDGDDDEVETTVKMADLSKAVRKTLKREARGGEIEEIKKETEDGKVVFEADVEYESESGELKYEIEIAEDGRLLSKVLEEEENDDVDDDEDDHDDDEEEDNG